MEVHESFWYPLEPHGTLWKPLGRQDKIVDLKRCDRHRHRQNNDGQFGSDLQWNQSASALQDLHSWAILKLHSVGFVWIPEYPGGAGRIQPW